ncbi:GFA family protein [Sphingopyxis sp. R3-92]|uniref:GFA family protein n=1 Tax=Sphingopyxis sp. R3-92 TaxID=3158553 RepID=UPI003EE81721
MPRHLMRRRSTPDGGLERGRTEVGEEPLVGKRYSGGCLCGSIRFEAVGTASNPHTCSCKICQRHSGSLTVAWVEFSGDQVTWTGPGGAPSTWRSSDFSSRAFCPACGSTLGAIDDKQVIALVLGTFDRPNGKELMPVAHTFHGARPKWWCVDAREAATAKPSLAAPRN